MSRETLRARIAAATEGPWSWDDDPDLTQDSVWADDGDIVASTYGSTAKGSTDADDARFIANARQDIPALLAVADAAAIYRDGLGSLLWVANNIHNHKTDTFRDFMESALQDWRKGYAGIAQALAALEALP